MGFIRILLTVFHFIIIALLFGMILNAYIPPEVFGFLNLLPLAFPILIIINILLVLFWIFSWKKRAFIFLLLSMFFVVPTRRWINFSLEKKEKPNLKIISLNANFGHFGNDKIYDFLNQQNADIVLFQEYDGKKFLDGFHYSENNYPIVKIQSRFPILESGIVKTAVNTGMCIYADIRINGKIIRFVDVYMEPFFIEKKMIKPNEDMDENEEKMKNVILNQLIPTFKKHQIQISQIKDFVDQSPYPVIVGGDFNAVPNSYEYYRISENMDDAFLTSGNGSGTSFHDFKFPLKIDHIFSSKSIEAISYKVDRSEKISDHFPVLAEFWID